MMKSYHLLVTIMVYSVNLCPDSLPTAVIIMVPFEMFMWDTDVSLSHDAAASTLTAIARRDMEI